MNFFKRRTLAREITAADPTSPRRSMVKDSRESLGRLLDLLRGRKETVLRDLETARTAFRQAEAGMLLEITELDTCIVAMEAARAKMPPPGPTGAMGPIGTVGVKIESVPGIYMGDAFPLTSLPVTPPHMRGMNLADGTEIPDGPAVAGTYDPPLAPGETIDLHIGTTPGTNRRTTRKSQK